MSVSSVIAICLACLAIGLAIPIIIWCSIQLRK